MNDLSGTPVPRAHRTRLFWILTFWFGALGPLIGGAPFNWMLLPILFSYFFGGLPALLAGALYGAAVITLRSRFQFGWMMRIVVGAACGALGCILASPIIDGTVSFSLIVFGAPAGAICAALYKKEWIDRRLFGEVGELSSAKPTRTFGST